MARRVRWCAGALLWLTTACASAPPAPAKPPGPTFQEKMASILKLEDERLLREIPPPLPPPPPPVKGRKVVPPPPPPPAPDLTRLLGDSEARVRRRAALAVGRVGLRDGITPLVALLSDAEPEVRQ